MPASGAAPPRERRWSRGQAGRQRAAAPQSGGCGAPPGASARALSYLVAPPIHRQQTEHARDGGRERRRRLLLGGAADGGAAGRFDCTWPVQRSRPALVTAARSARPQAIARSGALPLDSLRAARLACSAWGLGFAYGFRGVELRLADCEPASVARLLALLPPRGSAVRARVDPFEPAAPAALERLLAAAPAPLPLELVLELAPETTRAQAGTPTFSSFASAMRRCCAGRPFSIETDGDAAACCFLGNMLLEQIPHLLPGLTSFKSRLVALHDRELAPLARLSSLKVRA